MIAPQESTVVLHDVIFKEQVVSSNFHMMTECKGHQNKQTVQLYVQQPFNKMLTFLPKPCQMAASNEKQRNILLPITIIPTTYLHTKNKQEKGPKPYKKTSQPKCRNDSRCFAPSVPGSCSPTAHPRSADGRVLPWRYTVDPGCFEPGRGSWRISGGNLWG